MSQTGWWTDKGVGNCSGNPASLVFVSKCVETCRIGGRVRVPRNSGKILVAVLWLASSCSSGHSASTGPSDSAREICTAVGIQLGAPPRLQPAFALTNQVINEGEDSGDARLNVAVDHLSQAINRHSTTEIVAAEDQIATVCVRLGIWHVYHSRASIRPIVRQRRSDSPGSVPRVATSVGRNTTPWQRWQGGMATYSAASSSMIGS